MGRSSSNCPTRRFREFCRQLDQAAEIDELEITIAESAVRIRATDTDVIVNPECNVTAEVPRGEDAE